ncbi:hypothetical protein, partial [Actinoplanes sp. NPDC051494]|uniref:WXG100-like domain-containing protein n=1 Tax=Actinoplanes sp. NPDC051494 TaxID=3363907 RepID=UPI00378E5614
MANQTNGRASPEELRKLANDWRAQASRLESLGGTMMAAYKSITWTGHARLSATIAANAVHVKLKKMAESARDFAKFLDEYASKVEEQIKREKVSAIVQIVLAILGLLTLGLAVVLAPALAALSSLLASLLPAMSMAASRIVTMVLDFALGFITYGSMQVAMEFGTNAIVSAAVGVPMEVHGTTLLSVLLAGALGGLFSIRGIAAAPVRGGGGAVAPSIPKLQVPPKASATGSTTTNGPALNAPKPIGGTDSAGARINDAAPVVSASDVTAAPIIPTSGHATPTASGATGADARLMAAGSPGAAKSTGSSAQQATGHVNQPLAAPHTNAPVTGQRGGAVGGGRNEVFTTPRGGVPGAGEVRTGTPASGNLTSRPPATRTTDIPPMANLDRGHVGGGVPTVGARGDVSPVSTSSPRGSMSSFEVSPPASRGSFESTTTQRDFGQPPSPPRGTPSVAPEPTVSGTGAYHPSAQPHVTERGAVSAATGRGVSPDVPVTGSAMHGTTSAGQVTVPHGTTLPPALRPGGLPDTSALSGTSHLMPPTTRPGGVDHVPSTGASHVSAPSMPNGPGRVLDETAVGAAHPTTDQLRNQRIQALETPRPADGGTISAPPRTVGGGHTAAPSMPNGPGRVLDETAVGAAHPTTDQLRNQR